jgi:predicted ATPase/DNA-binding SARP family transcriptional activator
MIASGVEMEDNDFAPSVRVDLLGPLRLTVGGSPVEVPGPKRRAVLAMLAMAGGRALTADQLVDALWPTDPPESGRSALHSHVSRLRGHLGSGAARLITLDRGYRLILGADGTDLDLARTLLANGRAAAEEDPAAACQLLRQALALWRGPALADLSETAPMATEVAGLEQLRREITDLLISCAIEAGQADDVMPLAAEAVAADPLREPAVLLLMRALAVAGEPSHALQVGRAYRRRLTAEAGLDPSAHLAEVERDIARGIIGPHRTGAEAGGQPVTSAPPVPRPANRLIGREAQLVAVRRLLSTERLVTIVGPGGVGKTRLVLEVAQRAGNAAVLPLAPVTDPAAIPHALAAALGLRELRGDVLRACIAVLGNAPTLLVVDNCEHLLPAAVDVIATVLHGCRNVTVLATSREPLGLAAECSSRLAPLPLPGLEPLTAGDVDRLAHVPSVAVFLERAARVRPGFAPGPAELRRIADIVRRLDGIPLAIELAAGRLSSFSVADLSGRLDRALDLLGGSGTGQEDRHRTLRSTIEWSYQLLSSGERRLFRHLAVFPDGLDLDDAEAVAAELELTVDSGSALAHLVEASMINAIFGERTRYRMLETLRHFGLDRLAAEGEVAAAEQHLMRWALRSPTGSRTCN